MNGERDKIQSIIKKQYTAIHPSVEWRFKRCRGYDNSMPVTARRVVPRLSEFSSKVVYPLYGLSDIRASSTHRVAAIQADLLTQLELAMSILKVVDRVKPLPVLDELGYQIERSMLAKSERGLVLATKRQSLEFLKSEVEERLDHLGSYGEGSGGRDRDVSSQAGSDSRCGLRETTRFRGQRPHDQ